MNTEALVLAAFRDDLNEVQRILNDNPGIEVDTVDDIGYTPLLAAISMNRKPIIELLLAHGAAVNGPVGAFVTPLQQACNSDTARSDIVSLLIEHGAAVEATTAHRRRTPLSLACYWRTNLGIAQLLINSGADVNGGDGFIIAPLHEASVGGNTEAIELLIQSGADVNILSTEEWHNVPAGSTPLHFDARHARYDRLDCITQLLAAGADPNIINSAGQTPLHHAAWTSSVDVVNALLDAGCDPLHRDNDGRTPLQLFCESSKGYEEQFSAEHLHIITALVAAGDRSWECVPTPCPGLEAAMLSVWQAAPDELPELVKRMENPPQSLIELYARMDAEEMKKVVQEVLRVLHHHFSGFPPLKKHLLKCIFGEEPHLHQQYQQQYLDQQRKQLEQQKLHYLENFNQQWDLLDQQQLQIL